MLGRWLFYVLLEQGAAYQREENGGVISVSTAVCQ